MIDALKSFIDPLKNQVKLMIGRCEISKIDDSKGLQEIQAEGLTRETLDEIQRVQNYGFTSVPMPGATGVRLSINGNSDDSIFIAIDDEEKRKKDLAPGESSLYHHLGHYIHLKNDKSIELNSNKSKVVLKDDGEIELSSDTTTLTLKPNGHFVVKNDTSELIKELSLLITNLIVAQTVAGFPFSGATISNLNERLTKIKSFEG